MVGPWAARFRQAYLPPESPPGTPVEGSATSVDLMRPPAQESLPPEEVGRPWQGVRPEVWLTPDTPLRSAPRGDAELVDHPDAFANVKVLESRGDWHRVTWRGVEGWVRITPSDEPPLGRAPSPVVPIAPQPPDENLLNSLRELLGAREEVRPLGPYTLYTDVRDGALLEHLERVASRLEEVYVARYGRAPLGTPRAAVVLYASSATYRRAQEQSPRLAGLASSGHATTGLAVLYAEGSRESAASTLVHELVHLINRRAIGPALPPWLDEGMAEDLSSSEIGADGRPRPGTLGGGRRVSGPWIRFEGGQATLLTLRRRLREGGLPPLQGILERDWEGFVHGAPEDVQMRYALSGFWIRYLLDAENGRRADAFRAFLNAVAAGEQPSAEMLRESLGLPWRRLDAGLRVWLEMQLGPS